MPSVRRIWGRSAPSTRRSSRWPKVARSRSWSPGASSVVASQRSASKGALTTVQAVPPSSLMTPRSIPSPSLIVRSPMPCMATVSPYPSCVPVAGSTSVCRSSRSWSGVRRPMSGVCRSLVAMPSSSRSIESYARMSSSPRIRLWVRRAMIRSLCASPTGTARARTLAGKSLISSVRPVKTLRRCTPSLLSSVSPIAILRP